MATNYYALAIEWLEVAVQKLKVESNPMMQMAQNELENAIMVVSSSQLVLVEVTAFYGLSNLMYVLAA